MKPRRRHGERRESRTMTASVDVPSPLILLIEDEEQLRRFLRASLAAAGYRLIEAATGQEGLSLASQYVPEVILLDLGLPDLDGVEVARRLRAWCSSPIIVLSARGQEQDKVAGLDAGADDYLTKPFSFPELLARLRVALRHAAARGRPHDGEFNCGSLSVDLEARRVRVNGHEVRLTAIEYRLLTELIRAAGTVVTHRQLLQAVWGPGHAQDVPYLRVYMAHLRRKLESDPSRPRIFQTETGVGYRLRVEDD